MYKNIVFDLGGVVVDFAPHDFLLDRFYDEAIETKVYDITFGSVEWRQLDAGELDREAGNAAMLQKAAEARACWTTGTACSRPAAARWT